MANIGATTAFYKVETSLTRANSEVSKSMERLATGKQNASAGDRSSYVAMSDTFRLDYVGTKAGIKGASVVMGYLETSMRVLDAGSSLLSRLQELAVLGANATNTDADHKAIDAEAEAIADEFHRLLSTAKYKGKDLFTSYEGEYVSLGGRDSEMKFGIGAVSYSSLYGTSTRAVSGGPSNGVSVNMKLLPSDATAAKKFGDDAANPLVANLTYEIVSLNGTDGITGTGGSDAAIIAAGALTTAGGAISGTLTVGQQFTVKSAGDISTLAQGLTFKRVSGTDDLTKLIEGVQKNINTARVQAGSQYAAIESAVTYTTDLTAQYELGYNTVNDVNFSMETAHLAKNQILQQAATAMLAQANSGQQSLLQLIQG